MNIVNNTAIHINFFIGNLKRANAYAATMFNANEKNFSSVQIDELINDIVTGSEKLDTVKQIVKLDNFGQLTDSTDEASFIRLNTDREVEAFASICRYEGYCAPPPTEPGDYYYQPTIREDQFISIKKIVNYCKDVVKKLNVAEKILPDILKDAEWYDGAVVAEQLTIDPEVAE